MVFGLGFAIVLNQSYASASEIYDLYKAKKYQQITDSYGVNYLNLGYNELILLSESYKKLENTERHIKILKHLDTKKPNYFKIHLAIADASKDKVYKAILKGDDYKTYQQALTDAVEFYRSSIQLSPKVIAPYQGLMRIYKDQENVPEGLALTKTMLAQFGEKPEIVLDLCEWTRKFGLVAQTQKACLRASQLLPNSPKPLVNVALSIRDSGETEKYQEEILKTFEKFPNDEDVIDLVGEIHVVNKDYLNAEKVLSKNKNSKKESSRLNLLTAMYENEKYEESLAYFAESCSVVNEQRRNLLRYFETRLRRLEINGQEALAFKFQRELNSCRSTPVVITQENKIRASHFSEGIRLPANARDLEGQTLREKRNSYDQSKLKNRKNSDAPLKVDPENLGQ